MEEKKIRDVWTRFWNKSKFGKSIIELCLAIINTIIILNIRLWKLICVVANYIWNKVEEYTGPAFGVWTILLLLPTIYLGVKLKTTQDHIAKEVWEAKKNVDSMTAISFSKGYEQAQMEIKEKENAEKIIKQSTATTIKNKKIVEKGGQK